MLNLRKETNCLYFIRLPYEVKSKAACVRGQAGLPLIFLPPWQWNHFKPLQGSSETSSDLLWCTSRPPAIPLSLRSTGLTVITSWQAIEQLICSMSRLLLCSSSQWAFMGHPASWCSTWLPKRMHQGAFCLNCRCLGSTLDPISWSLWWGLWVESTLIYLKMEAGFGKPTYAAAGSSSIWRGSKNIGQGCKVWIDRTRRNWQQWGWADSSWKGEAERRNVTSR